MKRTIISVMALTAMLLIVTLMACLYSSGSLKNNTVSDNGHTCLEAYIGIYDDPEDGSGQLDYEKVLSVRIDGIFSYMKINCNRINPTDLLTETVYQSKWDKSINKLYTSGSIAFALTEAGSQIAVKNIALKEISH